MLQDGIIEESISSWSSPIIIVRKANGGFHLRNDFRRLNQVSEFDSYSMLRVDDLIEHQGRAWFISTLNFTKGYWKVALTIDTRTKTAFTISTTMLDKLHRAGLTPTSASWG